ncbi:hypothetical protein SAMN05660916_02199 [Arthrobacter sp. 31Cvi3.1E]|nr:hypothetical protein SAMN05660916_02199 [Arthrobacter sp. 31Cvi3.1E]
MARKSLRTFSWRNPGPGGAFLLAVFALCIAFGLVSAPAASAHDQLVSSTPSTGERLAVPPSAIELKFSAPLLAIGHEVRVVDAASKNWVQGDSALDRGTLTQPLAPGMPDGEYQVRWRVVSSDGHPINGSYSFLVGAGATAGAIPAPGNTATPGVPPGSAEPGATASTVQVPDWLIAAALGAAAGLALYLGWGFFKRRRRSGPRGG